MDGALMDGPLMTGLQSRSRCPTRRARSLREPGPRPPFGIVPVTVGLLSPGASAGVASEQTQSERARVVKQLTREYPRLQLGSVLPATDFGAPYRVELVRPGEQTCDLVLGPGIGPRVRFPRLPEDPIERRVRAMDERPCPLPVLPVEDPVSSAP